MPLQIAVNKNEIISQDMLKIWEAKISRDNWKMKPTDRLCELHFRSEDIIHQLEVEVNGKIIVEKFKSKRLKEGAIPVLFSHRQPPKKRKPPAPRTSSVPETKRNRIDKQDKETSEGSSTVGGKENVAVDVVSCAPETSESSPTVAGTGNMDLGSVSSPPSQNEKTHEGKNKAVDTVPQKSQEPFQTELFKNPHKVKVPDDWIIRHKEDLKFIHVDDRLVKIDKYIVIEKDKDIAKVFLRKKEVPALQGKLENLDQTSKFISKVDSLRLCPGTGICNNKKSDTCMLYFELPVVPNKKPPPRCHDCLLKRKAIQRSIKRKEVSARKKAAKIRSTHQKVRTQRLTVRKMLEFFFLLRLNSQTVNKICFFSRYKLFRTN